jgi:CheY-like chemotaxis protein
MNTNYHILFIEDEPEKWNRFFNTDEGEQEYGSLKVDNATTLKNGLEAIRQKHLVLDGVLIEYNFPNTTSADVLEAISWIKKKHPTLPVFILCATPESEDLSTITAFIRAGAVNYFNISNFKPAYLAAHLWSSRENMKVLRQYEMLTTPSGINSSVKPYLHIEQKDSMGVNGCFAYALEVVKKPRTDDEEEEFLEYAERWHREFFRMLALLLDDQISLTIKYNHPPSENNKNPSTVRIYWQFNLQASDTDVLAKEYEKTIRDLSLYLGVHSLFPYNPYIFSPVTNESHLESIKVPEVVNQYIVKRKSVDCSSSLRQIGYKNKNKQHQYPLLSVFKKPEDWSSINSFCNILMQEEGYAQFEISIQACRLSARELEEATKWASGLPENFPLQGEEAELYQHFLEGLSRSTLKPFKVQFSFFTTEAFPNDALQAAIFNAFALEVIEKDKHSAQDILFADIYPDRGLSMFARNPLPQKEGIPGIITIPQNMLFLPNNISEDGVLVGHKLVNNRWNDIRISHTDLSQHAYILGQTGTGKSTLLYTMVMALLESGKHVSLIDPHGDLYDKVVKNLPDSCRENTILFDPSSVKDIPGINFLQHDPSDPFQKSYILSAIYVILDSLYDMKLTGGPIFIKYLQAAMRLVMENQGSLLDVIRVFENKTYRNELLANIKDPDLISEWNEILDSGGETSFANLSVYITSKLNEFRNNIILREILRKKEKQLDFSDIMNHGKNLLVRLPVGSLGERGVNLVGQIIFNKFLMTAFSREKIPEEQRLNHILVVDEFHKFTTDALGKVFSEARKYHLSLVVANQTFSQLNDVLQHLLLGNVGSMLFFRPGINDAQVVARYLEPDFNAGELCNLPNYQCAARISINQRPSKPFIFETIRIELQVEQLANAEKQIDFSNSQ